MIAEIYTACERLLSATVNGVYQGIIVAALAGVALRLIPRTNAATRQAVWFGTLLVVVALIPAHLVLDGRRNSGVQPVAIEPVESAMAVALPPVDLSEPQTESLAVIDEGESSTSLAGNIGVEPAADGPISPQPGVFETAVSLPHWIGLCLVSAWIVMAEIRGGLIALQLLEIRRAKNGSRPANAALQALFDNLRGAGAVRRNVRLRMSATQRGPALLGFIHPVIILPAEMESAAHWDEAEVVLRHELAHVKRYDDWANLLQQLIQSALFFHPAIKWISARLTLEREIACDDQVLEAVDRPRTYALTLTNIASRMSQCRQSLSPGVSSNNSQLKQRINMILNTHRDRSPRPARSRVGFVTSATALLAVLAIVAGPRMVVAESPGESEKGAGALALTTSADEKDSKSQPASPESELAAPLPPVAPVRPVAPAKTVGPVPKAARPLKGPASVEDRLDRIERMLENLEAREGKTFRYELFSDQAAKQAAKASDISKRIYGQSLGTQYQQVWQSEHAKVPVHELEALRHARESLRHELEKMEEQIKKLEQQQDKLKKSDLDGSNDGEEPAKPKPSAKENAR